ncbi:MAG: cytochrome C [Sulfurimonadaceae bacterium]|jgi:bacillopeptidase F (M6 metalloprotease family)|nr:cytochrome C [Sulfurimonadaceae bacterium]
MNKMIKLALAATLVLGLSATTASADVKKGQQLFTKKLKDPCGMTGAALAGKHTQDEWTEINEDGKLAAEIKTLCPNVKDADLKDNFLEHYFDFFHEFGSDSGNVPSC